MEQPATPANEAARLQALRALGLLDTPPEERFDRFTRLARRIFDVPIALITLVDAERQWFKSRQGVEVIETDRTVSFCAHTIVDNDLMVVEDATRDSRFADNPLVTGEPTVRFYAACPIRAEDGMPLGTLCIIDRKPRVLGEDDRALLCDLAHMVEVEFTILRLATTDDLTGLSNRRGFVAMADHSLALCRRLKVPATLVYFDLDGFKDINDRFGHVEGDAALVSFASTLLANLRAADVVARVGGDEFCALLTNTDAAQLDTPLARLAQAISTENAARAGGWQLRYSAGAVDYDPLQHETLSALIAAADREMYRQKRARKTV